MNEYNEAVVNVQNVKNEVNFTSDLVKKRDDNLNLDVNAEVKEFENEYNSIFEMEQKNLNT